MNRSVPTSHLVAMLKDARARTLELVADLDADQLMGPKLDIVNPPLWEIGHVGWFHEFFALRQLMHSPPLLAPTDALYNSSVVPHDIRWQLPLPSLRDTIDYMTRVEAALIERLRDPTVQDPEKALYLLSLYHEDMHGEALTYTRQTLGYPVPALSGATRPAVAGPWPGDAAIPGGPFWLGSTPDAPFLFDNEKWAHPLEVCPFHIARAPVTNGEFAAFVEDGGYREPRYWDEEGWRWREAAGAGHPLYWVPEGAGRFSMRHFDNIEPFAPHQPVIHVNWYEANAWCRWADRRLPTELEWEVAAAGEPAPAGGLAACKRAYPWGDGVPTPEHANLDGIALDCVDVAAHPQGDSAWGCRQMIGNVWEWTASRFEPYPGFMPDVYEDYSKPWFGTRKVLRGGAWATRSRMITNSYRNFFTPERRDVYAGFRTAAL